MRILQANKFFYPKGGADRYFLDLADALKAAGHEVAVFAMEDERNISSPYAKYFVPKVEFNGGGFRDGLRIPGRMIYSLKAKRRFAREIEDFKPDVIHVHNIYHQLSPSILDAAKEKGIPVIMHLHDYKLVCPNYRLFTKGRYCRQCLDKKSYRPCIKNDCYGSCLKSSLAALEMTIHHKWLHIYEKDIDLLIAPSEFMRRLAIEGGWPEEKVVTIYNPAPQAAGNTTGDKAEKDHLLYFGRLVPEKGITSLIEVAIRSGHKLRIAGDGPEENNIKEKFKEEISGGQVELLGRLSGKPLRDEIAEARAVVFPSIWPENMPLALMEALSAGKIVIASRIGGMPEIVDGKTNGFLFEAGNIESLIEAITAVYSLDKEREGQIKAQAVKTAAKHDPGVHLQNILKIYTKLAKKSG